MKKLDVKLDLFRVCESYMVYPVTFMAKQFPVTTIRRVVFSIPVYVVDLQFLIRNLAPIASMWKEVSRSPFIDTVRTAVFILRVFIKKFILRFCTNSHIHGRKPSTYHVMTNPKQKSYFSTGVPLTIKVFNFFHRKFYKTVSLSKSGMGYVSGFYSFIPSNTLGHRYYNNMDRRLWV